MRAKRILLLGCALVLTSGVSGRLPADDFDQFVEPVVTETCAACHDSDDPEGDVNLAEISSGAWLLNRPELIQQMFEAVDANDMPPADQPALDAVAREKFLGTLKSMLNRAATDTGPPQNPIRRLNRFQYNYAVKDLLQLNRDVFPLPEKLMTRQSEYLNLAADQMPERVRVVSHSLNPQEGLRDVEAFPKDLRAAHGFDNQANQLSLSPLLLDAFLRLSVSIVESPDFNEQNVGVWDSLFGEPADGVDMRQELHRRLEPFLKLAFRGPVEADTVERYATYATAKMDQGLSFTDTMKKVTSAVLSSPLFLYRSSSAKGRDAQYELASDLSFFLWGSGPDAELLRLAERGQLGQPDILNVTMDRMFADPKIERFLDAFPAQWLQLENVLAAAPDPQRYRLFHVDANHPASLQMVLEPLLLFDAMFVENRPVAELITPEFSYRSDFLQTWYTSDLQPPQVDVEKVVEQNQRNEARRQEFTASVQTMEAQLEALLSPIRKRLLAEKREQAEVEEPVDLKPYAAWEFDGHLRDSINTLHLQPHGDIEFRDGMVVLERAYLLSETIPVDLKAKTLEVWCLIHDLDQSGGGLMGIQGPGDFFDTIVLGERQARHWISGSNGFSRTDDFPDSTPELTSRQMLHLVMVYQEDGTTRLYRNGVPYGKPYRGGSATFPKDQTSVIFGLRHLPPGGNKYLSVSIDSARLYDRALTAEEVAASGKGNRFYVTNESVLQALSPAQRAEYESLRESLTQAETALAEVPPTYDPATLQREAEQRYDDEIRSQLRSPLFARVNVDDPRYGGVITNAAMLSMTSGPTRTQPIARGAWVIEVVFNDPPAPPPNDVPPLTEDNSVEHLTIREAFAKHRENSSCAACHAKLDPLGFALENFDITGRWRDRYENGRDVDASGTLLRKYDFADIVEFKQSLSMENERFARAFTGHLLRFALSRELGPFDSLTLDSIVAKTEGDEFRLRSLIREVIRSESFWQSD